MSDEGHCEDCCCARSWDALGISEYTGRSIPDEIERLRKRVDEFERGEVKWAVLWEDGFGELAPSQEAANKLAASVENLGIGYRIVRVRVTEIPEEEADE